MPKIKPKFWTLSISMYTLEITYIFQVFYLDVCRGSALQRRLLERTKEMETDDRDRQKEKVELEEIRRRLMEEGHIDVEAEMARVSDGSFYLTLTLF